MSKADTLIRSAERRIAEVFQGIAETAYVNQGRVLECFRQERVSTAHFAPTTGYGYNDRGRETLEAIYATIFGCEDALVRSQIISGTHAIAGTMMALLEPGDLLVSAMGGPYDTLKRVIEGKNGLISKGIQYREARLSPNGGFDVDGLIQLAQEKPKMVLLQRSRGYSIQRISLTMAEIGTIIQVIKSVSPSTIILVDNCYGEFVQLHEPGHAGADLVAGSLIKNPGGGLAAGGGYVAGRAELVECVADHFVAPGLGKEIGPSLVDLRLVYQGLFISPHVVAEALKGAVLTAAVFEELGNDVYPVWDDPRGDIVQAVGLADQTELERFARIVQMYSPVDSMAKPEFAALPGYDDPVIMAAGTFVQGSSIELSCDAPARPPYMAFFQGGITYAHVRYVVEQLIRELT